MIWVIVLMNSKIIIKNKFKLKYIVNYKIMNPWLEHVKKVRAKNKGLSYKEALQKAKASYKKGKGKKMKKQGTSARTNEKQGMEIKGLKSKMKKSKMKK